MMVSCDVGFVPYAALPLGMGLNILETFLLEKALKPSGAIAV
jgi:hypothetical protein